MYELERLKSVPLRDIWIHEAHAFTKWLAQEDSLALLSDALDLEITLVDTEAGVGDFSVDMLAVQTTSGKNIVIENQLERTDHDHLGKIITYASGVDAEYIIWVVANVRDEHKRAVDWLNEHTDKDLNFFLVKIELWQIGTSSPAPKFDVVCQPNDWAKLVKQSANSAGSYTETKLRQLEFWERFREYAQTQKTRLQLRKPSPQHWYDISSGASNWHISLTTNSVKKKMACEIYISEDKEQFRKFEASKDAIEQHLGSDMEWMELPNKKASRIKQSSPCDLNDTEKWPEYFAWLLYRAESFYKIFNEQK